MSAARFSLEQPILRYYEGGEEADRLESRFTRWEKVRTLDLLDRFLQPVRMLFPWRKEATTWI